MKHVGGWTFSNNFSSLALPVCERHCFEDLEKKYDIVTELIIRYKGVCRTGPAIACPLKIKLAKKDDFVIYLLKNN